MTATTSTYWLVSVPNVVGYGEGYSFISLSQSAKSLADCYKLDPLCLKMGTLNSLITLSDELGRHDNVCEGSLRKIEKQYLDLNGISGSEQSSILNSSHIPLTVSNMTPKNYVERFKWNVIKYPKSLSLTNLVSMILQNAISIENELKLLTLDVSETISTLTTLSRKKGGNLLSCPLDEFISPEMATSFIQSEFLRTVGIVVPSSFEEEFLETYHTIGQHIVGFGDCTFSTESSSPKSFISGCSGDGLEMSTQENEEEGRFCVRGSPVVPGSAVKLVKDGDYSLYAVVTLKGMTQSGYLDESGDYVEGSYCDFFDPLSDSFKQKRCVLRRLHSDLEMVVAIDTTSQNIVSLELELQSKRSSLEQWCRSHYGEALEALIHLKVIRGYVESILRYGINSVTPSRESKNSNFVMSMMRVESRNEAKLKALLYKISEQNTGGSTSSLVNNVEGDEDIEEDYLPYCLLEFNL